MSNQIMVLLPWAYEDSYFIYRGEKEGVVNRTDNLILAQGDSGYAASGRFTSDLLTLPPGMVFTTLTFTTDIPVGTTLRASVLDGAGGTLREDATNGDDLQLAQPVRLHFGFKSTNSSESPLLDAYHLKFAAQDAPMKPWKDFP